MSGDLERRVSLTCPVCGGDQFAYADNDEAALVTCSTCGRQATRDALIEENSERIDAEFKKMGEQVLDDAAKQLRGLGFK
jgi:predicted  nucleic acid-binding Zn-ribbon protein